RSECGPYSLDLPLLVRVFALCAAQAEPGTECCDFVVQVLHWGPLSFCGGITQPRSAVAAESSAGSGGAQNGECRERAFSRCRRRRSYGRRCCTREGVP